LLQLRIPGCKGCNFFAFGAFLASSAANFRACGAFLAAKSATFSPAAHSSLHQLRLRRISGCMQIFAPAAHSWLHLKNKWLLAALAALGMLVPTRGRT
jgi:hypothetical protein